MSQSALLRRYRELPDHEIENFALCDIRHLSEMARQVLQSEVERRGILSRLEWRSVLAAQTQQLGPAERSILIERVRQLSCLRCGRSGARLNACEIAPRPGASETVFACPECIRTAAKEARGRLIRGHWWEFLSNPLAIASAFDRNTAAELDCDLDEASPTLVRFVDENRGAIALLLEKAPLAADC